MAENYKFIDYEGDEMGALFNKINDLDVATQSKAGLMSATDKTKLDNLPAGAQENVLEGVQLAGVDLDITEKKVNIPVDNAPTEGSSALIRSGAVAAKINQLGHGINDFVYKQLDIMYYQSNAIDTIDGYIAPDGSIVSSNALTKVFDVEGSSRVIVTGRQGNDVTQYALAGAYDNNNNLLQIYIGEPATSYNNNFGIELPASTKYVKVCTSNKTIQPNVALSVNKIIDGLERVGTTPISANTDLNTLTYGVYSFLSSVTPTLVNSPVTTGGGMLIVERPTPASDNYRRQTIIMGTSGISYYRTERGINVWTNWQQYASVENINNIYNRNNVTVLSAGTDLNTLTYGVYSFSGSISSSLIHTPRNSGGGMLIVERSTPSGSYCKQTAVYGVGETYYRYYTDTWTDWQKETSMEIVNSELERFSNDIFIPSYWQSEINSSIESILTNRLIIGSSLVEFIFITDTHWLQNAKKSSNLVAYLQKALDIDTVVFGGDAIDYSQNTKLKGLKELQDFVSKFNYTRRLFYTLGNHDKNSYNNAGLSNAELYTTIGKQIESFGITNKSISVSYFDNETQKVRYVQYSYELTDAQRVVNTFKDLPSDWTVVLFTHEYWEAPAAGSGDSPTVIADKRTMMNNIIAGTYNCTIAAFIVGHVHSDQNGVLDNNIPIISTTTDCIAKNLYGGPTMTLNTDTEQAFEIVQIDTVNKKLYYTRVGAGSDREFSY